MSTTALLIWFIATAVMTASVLVIGTLAAAGMLSRKQRHRQPVAASLIDVNTRAADPRDPLSRPGHRDAA